MRTRIIAPSILIAGLLACSGVKQGANTGIEPEPTVVQVDNQGFLDMTVYAVRSAQRYRLGTATGNTKTSFNIPTVLMSGITPIRFVADPIGGIDQRVIGTFFAAFKLHPDLHIVGKKAARLHPDQLAIVLTERVLRLH